MKSGRLYEEFVYKKFRGFFKGFTVTFDDKITGKDSNIRRQIDISIRGTVEGVELLYVVQCKDYSKPANIVTIGEFSPVIKDIGASKGFLVCASGLAKTIHDYAIKLGIELLSVEDINSDKWRASIRIPIIFIKNEIQWSLSVAIVPNKQLQEKNKEPIQVSINDLAELSLDGGKTAITIGRHIDNKLKERGLSISDGLQMDLHSPGLFLRFSGVWVPLEKLIVTFRITKRCYLKYALPEEYAQIKNHLSGEVIPLHFYLKVPLTVDPSYVEIDSTPISTGINIIVEEKLGSLENAKLDLQQFVPRR